MKIRVERFRRLQCTALKVFNGKTVINTYFLFALSPRYSRAYAPSWSSCPVKYLACIQSISNSNLLHRYERLSQCSWSPSREDHALWSTTAALESSHSAVRRDRHTLPVQSSYPSLLDAMLMRRLVFENSHVRSANHALPQVV
jgi:hypothetical protein